MARYCPTEKAFDAFARKAGYLGTGPVRTKRYAHGVLFLELLRIGVEFRRVNGTGRTEVVTLLNV